MHLGPLVTALVDGELQQDVQQRALEHAGRCPACRAEIEAQRRLKARVAVAAPPAPPEALTRRLLELAAPAPPPRPRVRRTGRPTLLTGAALSLSGVVVGTAFALGASAPRQPTPVPPPVDLLTVQSRSTPRPQLPPPEEPLLRRAPAQARSTPAPLVRPVVAPMVLTSAAPLAPPSSARR